jgi:hypothetical protein
LFLTCVAAVPGLLALRANFEVLQKAHNFATVVDAIITPHQRFSAKLVEHVGWLMSPLSQPVYHAGQDMGGDVVTLHDPSRRGDPGAPPYMTNLAGVWTVHVHVSGE